MTVTLSVAAQPRRTPALDSAGLAGSAVGANVSRSPVLDVIEQLLIASKHPDIVKIERYGPNQGPWGPSVKSPGMDKRGITGVKVTHQSTATASIWEAIWPGETPINAPAEPLPPRPNRAPRLAILITQLLDVAKPAQFKAWRLVALPDLGPTDKRGAWPAGVSIVDAAGKQQLLRVTATGVLVGEDPEEDPFPDYQIPEEVKTCLNGSSTPKTSPCPPVGAVSATCS